MLTSSLVTPSVAEISKDCCTVDNVCSNDTQTNILILTAHPAKRFLTEGCTGEEEPEVK